MWLSRGRFSRASARVSETSSRSSNSAWNSPRTSQKKLSGSVTERSCLSTTAFLEKSPLRGPCWPITLEGDHILRLRAAPGYCELRSGRSVSDPPDSSRLPGAAAHPSGPRAEPPHPERKRTERKKRCCEQRATGRRCLEPHWGPNVTKLSTQPGIHAREQQKTAKIRIRASAALLSAWPPSV